jgi:hypothetical protein
MKFRELDVVKTIKVFPEYNLKEGVTGTIVHIFSHPNEAYEVEFSDEAGRTVVMATLLPDDLEIFKEV